jgi:hypothetical protein
MRLKELVQLSESELAVLDVGVMHNICAQGLPGGEDLRPESGSRQLDEMAHMIEVRTAECEWMFCRRPK